MTRKHRLFPLALALLGAACAPPASPNLAIQTSQHWLISTVDSYLDAGRSASLAIDSDGSPHLVYLSLQQTLPKGVIAPARPLTLPLIPAIETAAVEDGVWSHGDVIATQEVTKPLPLKTTDGVAMTLDANGNEDVAFTESGQLMYSTAQAGGTFGSTDKVAAVKNAVGLSIAAASDGTPWISWLDGPRVMAATKAGRGWQVEPVAALAGPAQDPQRTSIQSNGHAVWIAYSDPSGPGPMVAESTPGGWAVQAVDPGAGGEAISLAIVEGTAYAAYYTRGGDIRRAKSSDGVSWSAATVAKTGAAPDPAGAGASIAVTDKGVQYVAWNDPKQNDIHLAAGTGDTFSELPVTGTMNGERPIVAVTPDGSEAFVAYYDKVNLDLLLGEYVVNGTPQLTLAGVPSPVTGGTSTPPPGASCKPSGSTVDVVAQGIKFTSSCYAAPAGQGFTISFDNKDAGTPHNFDVLDAAGGKHVFGAEPSQLVTGPDSATYGVSPQQPGTYYFQCDIHPTSMFGTFVVK